ncbi:MAG: class II fructose-bisphosphatase [Actinobacteria bacterium]|nr:class II fructose-bisphosphatase [Actinomycetota bacterium]
MEPQPTSRSRATFGKEILLLRALGLELLSTTEAAALAAAGWAGRGDHKEADRRAVDGMRAAFSIAELDGVVVTGEGEKDDAPMLFNGERVGNGRPPMIDLAIDPLEGTRLLAETAPNSVSVVGAAERGAMWSPGPAFYMDKLAVPREAASVIDMTAPPGVNLARIAKALDKEIGELAVFVLDKPRHAVLIADIREAGARVKLAPDGDVLGGILAALPNGGVDVLMGVGGTPEAVILACALKALGGEMQCRLAPQKEDERANVRDHGLDTSRILTVDELVHGEHSVFAATGVTGGDLLEGVGEEAGHPTTSSLLLDSVAKTVRFVRTVHDTSVGAPEEPVGRSDVPKTALGSQGTSGS